MRPAFTVVEAPSVLGLRPSGVEKLPDALLGAGLADRLDARRAGRVEPPAWEPERDPATKMLNPRGVATYSRKLADFLEPLLSRGEWPIVLGGDCSILLGSMLALRRRQDGCGLLFLDGHADYYSPEEDPYGEAASMDLALATGHGPVVITDLDGRGPLVRTEDVVGIGMRDAEEDPAYRQGPVPAELQLLDLSRVRRDGIEAVSRQALEHLLRPGAPERFWIHLDADVLDDAVMPAVDYRMPGGLSWDELATVLSAAMASGRAAGLEIAIFNPKLDPDGRIAAEFVRTLVRGLSS
jgi:arginase